MWETRGESEDNGGQPEELKEGRGGLRWALRQAPYGCPSPLRRTYLGSAERMPPTAGTGSDSEKLGLFEQAR